jgi:protoporphyrinogen oxidase
MERVDAVVLGAGPAGLGAGLALARAGAAVAVLEAADRPGGLCVTRRRGGFGYDLGGHIPFVRDEARRAWLEDLLGGDLAWVDRPVASVRDGRVVRGRYLDQRPDGPVDPAPADGSARGELGGRFGEAFVDRVMRPYLEKIDGVPLERIPAERARRLLEDQAAPEGFWFPGGGIGQLMDAMGAAVGAAGGRLLLGTRATAIEAPGGRVAGVAATGPDGPRAITADALVVSVPAGLAARLVRPEPPGDPTPQPRMRAVCLVYLQLERERVSDEPWIQVDDPRVPFSRAFEPRNWSPRMAPPGRTVIGLECYCRAEPDDPVWGLDDDALAGVCAAALADPLGWIADAREARALEVVRLPRAYPVPDLLQMPVVLAPGRRLEAIAGVQLAPGAAVIEAIEAGERAARRVIAGNGGPAGARADGDIP